MIREVADPAIINGFANHLEIRPSLGGDGVLDLTPGIKPPNVFLFGEHGGTCWSWSAPRTFECHVMLTREGRGRWGVRAVLDAVEYMKGRASLLWARVHPERPEIAVFARLCGFGDTGERNELDLGDGPVAWRIFERRF